jgi:hypothetical protein
VPGALHGLRVLEVGHIMLGEHNTEVPGPLLGDNQPEELQLIGVACSAAERCEVLFRVSGIAG